MMTPSALVGRGQVTAGSYQLYLRCLILFATALIATEMVTIDAISVRTSAVVTIRHLPFQASWQPVYTQLGGRFGLVS